jgi:hypothetical protein
VAYFRHLRDVRFLDALEPGERLAAEDQRLGRGTFADEEHWHTHAGHQFKTD